MTIAVITIVLFLISLLLWNGYSEYPIMTRPDGDAGFRPLNNLHPTEEEIKAYRKEAIKHRGLFFGCWLIIALAEWILIYR